MAIAQRKVGMIRDMIRGMLDSRAWVYIYAYTSTNLGDDLLVLRLCREFPDSNFVISCPKEHSRAFSTVPNLLVIPRLRTLGRLLNLVHRNYSHLEGWISSRCDAVVNIGGSIFIQNVEWRVATSRHRRRIASAKQYFIVGANFGPWDDPGYRDACVELFKNATDVCFRDSFSYELFKELDNVRHAPDVVLSYGPIRASHSQEKAVVISVIDLSDREGLRPHREAYETMVVELAKGFVKEDHAVVLMSFCTAEGDNRAISRIMRRPDMVRLQNRVSAYAYEGDVQGALDFIGSAQLVVSTRLHSLILAWLLGKPVYPIVYSEKIVRVVEDSGFPGPCSRIDDLGHLSATDILANARSMPPADVMRLNLEASEQFAGLRLGLGISAKTDQP